MTLFEITNDFLGECYVRVYVWAATEADALTLAGAAYRSHEHQGRDPHYSDTLTCKRLFSADSPAFATYPSDNGWETGDER